MAQLQAQYQQHQQQMQQQQAQGPGPGPGQAQGGMLAPDGSTLMRDISNVSFLAGLPSGDYSNMGSGNFGACCSLRLTTDARESANVHTAAVPQTLNGACELRR